MVQSQPQRTSPARPARSRHRREDQGPEGAAALALVPAKARQARARVPGEGVGREGPLAPAATQPSPASVSSPVRCAWPSPPCSAVRCVSHSVNKQFPSPSRQALSGEVQMLYEVGASQRPRIGPGERQTSHGPASRGASSSSRGHPRPPGIRLGPSDPSPSRHMGKRGPCSLPWATGESPQPGLGCHAGTHRAPGSKVCPPLHGASSGLSVHGPLGGTRAPACTPASRRGAA